MLRHCIFQEHDNVLHSTVFLLGREDEDKRAEALLVLPLEVRVHEKCPRVWYVEIEIRRVPGWNCRHREAWYTVVAERHYQAVPMKHCGLGERVVHSQRQPCRRHHEALNTLPLLKADRSGASRIPRSHAYA